MVLDIMATVDEHESWRMYNCINLIPSENITSPQVRALLSCDMGHRYTHPANMKVHGMTVENAYRGTRFTDEVEAECVRLACKVYNAKYACVKPIAGHIAAMISLLATMEKGKKLLAVNSSQGGYDGYDAGYFPDIMGYKSGALPFDEKGWKLDTKKATVMIKKEKPKATVIGQSFILFPYDLKEIHLACKSVKSHLLYDASHVLGLIAGGQFQHDPLANGTDLMYGSTHKTLFGPQGGIILTNNEVLHKRISQNITWRSMDNAHWNRIAALAQALREMEEFGRYYAPQVIRNAQALGKALNERGLPIKFADAGYTQSHQLAIDLIEVKKKLKLEINDLAVLLEQSNIITDAVGRLGTNETTRIGMKEQDMEKLAELMVTAVKERRNVTEEVRLMRKDFEIEYCFK